MRNIANSFRCCLDSSCAAEERIAKAARDLSAAEHEMKQAQEELDRAYGYLRGFLGSEVVPETAQEVSA